MTVTVASDADLAATGTLASTLQNWNVAQIVAIGAANDALVGGPETAK